MAYLYITTAVDGVESFDMSSEELDTSLRVIELILRGKNHILKLQHSESKLVRMYPAGLLRNSIISYER